MKYACEIYSNIINPQIALEEHRKIEKKFVPIKQHGPYHDGSWKSIALFAANGDMKNDKLIQDVEYKKTSALSFAPHLEALIDKIPGKKKRVRLLSLPSKAKIYEHFDSTDSMDRETSRLHMPIITHNDVIFLINNQRVYWTPGNIYYGDFSFPHSVINNSNINRIHLVIDVINNNQLEKMIKKAFGNQFPSDYSRKFAQLKFKIKRKLGFLQY